MKIQFVLSLFWLLLFLTVANLLKTARITTNLQDFTNFLDLLQTSCKASILACFWVFRLTANDMIFGWVRRLLYLPLEMPCNKNFHRNWNYLLKPILTCEECTTGNFCFWIYLIIHIANFSFIDCIFTISLAIFITILTRKLWQANS